jgi:redox-sensitive bicupin YhaK (pirin superfamily)
MQSTNRPISRAVKRVLQTQGTQDGAGVSLYRAIGIPALREIDPFLLLDEMHSHQPDDYIAGFPSHPHRGFETLRYMVSGKMRHRDSRGNEGVVDSGGVQWMSAARGIIHSEIPEQDDGLLWGYQLWINLPSAKKMDEPQYRDIPAAEIPTVALQRGGFIKVIAGEGIANQLGPVARDDIGLVFLDVFLPRMHASLSRCQKDTPFSRSSQRSRWNLAAAVTTRRRWCANARSPCSKKEIM